MKMERVSEEKNEGIEDFKNEYDTQRSDETVRIRRIRAAAAKNHSGPAKKIRRSVTPSILKKRFNDCVLHLRENCKSTVDGGYRLSATEACCSNCFNIAFRGKDYERLFIKWKKRANDGQTSIKSDQFVKRYINSTFLPFYPKCKECKKYNRIDDVEEMCAENFAEYKCPEGCEKMIEWSYIDLIRKDKLWYSKYTGVAPLLQNNVAYSLLVDNYVTRTAGMDASCQSNARLIDDGGIPFRDTKKIMNMFYVPFTDVIANVVHPEFMEADEKLAFPRLAEEAVSIYYLMVRNTIIAMWLKHPFAQITAKMVEAQIIVRGHARIFLIEHLITPILEFLTIKGVVNYGAFDFRINPVHSRKKIAIIGSGISGMSAARHLQHLGFNPVIFEAKDRYGGRMNDDKSLGVAVGKGAQIIVGNINNPITLLCEQIGIKYRNSNWFCPLIDDENGKCYTLDFKQLDDQVDLHYNNVLDAIRNKFSIDKTTPDQPLEEMFERVSRGLLNAAGLTELFTPEFEKLLNFHLGNLEFSCGAKVMDLSSKEYDHNEKFGNFAGEHAVITDGAQSIVDFLSKGLDIHLNSAVRTINWSGSKVILTFENNCKPMEFDKVIVTTSLAVLKKSPELFFPPLPEKKRNAIESLGAGLIEKIAVRFDRRFWKCVDQQGIRTDYFGRVPNKKEDRSLFNIFYDFSGKTENGEETFVLMSYVTADHVNLVNEFSDEHVAGMFVETLRKMFPKEEINPIGHMVSHWGADPYIGMSYTFVPFGSGGDDTYNALKETVDEKLYFAGEHTMASEPQTMTGAFLSGLREAGKIVLSMSRNVHKLDFDK